MYGVSADMYGVDGHSMGWMGSLWGGWALYGVSVDIYGVDGLSMG